MLASDDDLDARFSEALALHQRTPDAFERARTELAYGARLRRDGGAFARARNCARRSTPSSASARRHGSSKATAELAATGETARRRAVSTLDQLAPQLQIALLLSKGQTTRAAAAQLFLSPKTVEYHLRHVYRKRGIRSRAELSASVDAAHPG